MPDELIPPAAREVLERPLVAHLSTVSPKGLPQSSIVWFELDGEELVLFSEAATPKVRNLQANPRIDVVVVDPERELGAGTPLFVRVTGRAVVGPEEDGLVDRLSVRYGHPDGYPREATGRWGRS